MLPFPTFTKGLWQVLREEMAARRAAGGGPASPFATVPPVAPALTASIFPRLGCLFLDFKGRPLLCAAYFGVKLAKNVVKGVMVGVFYGEAAAASAACLGYDWPFKAQVGRGDGLLGAAHQRHQRPICGGMGIAD